jgi:hypothetical protein
MSIDPNVLAEITAAVGVLGKEFLDGVASDAGKAAWTHIKAMFGWTSDPAPAEISAKAISALSESKDPDLTQKILELLKSDQTGRAAALVGNLVVSSGGKVVIAYHIGKVNMN